MRNGPVRTRSRYSVSFNPGDFFVLIPVLKLYDYALMCGQLISASLLFAIPSLTTQKWNSALAVSYPARKFGIVRGDSYEKIREKSKGECVCIHLPVTTLNDNASPVRGDETLTLANDSQNGNNEHDKELPPEEDVKASYDAEFNQPAHIREEMYQQEKNRMRSRNEGKACLDR